MCGYGAQKHNINEAGNVIYTSGCIDKLVDWIHSNLFLLGGIALGLAIPQVIIQNNDKEISQKKKFRHPDMMSTIITVLIAEAYFFLCCVRQLVGIFLSQNLINQIKDQIQLQQYSSAHRSDPWRWLDHGWHSPCLSELELGSWFRSPDLIVCPYCLLSIADVDWLAVVQYTANGQKDEV